MNSEGASMRWIIKLCTYCLSLIWKIVNDISSSWLTADSLSSTEFFGNLPNNLALRLNLGYYLLNLIDSRPRTHQQTPSSSSLLYATKLALLIEQFLLFLEPRSPDSSGDLYRINFLREPTKPFSPPIEVHGLRLNSSLARTFIYPSLSSYSSSLPCARY